MISQKQMFSKLYNAQFETFYRIIKSRNNPCRNISKAPERIFFLYAGFFLFGNDYY